MEIIMTDWNDFNGDGEIDGAEAMFAEEMLCTDGEEHNTLFGNNDGSADDFNEDDDLFFAGLDKDELEFMDEDERNDALIDAGLDPDDYEF